MQAFGKFLREHRDASGLSAEQVVHRLQRYHVKLDNSTLYNYEAGTVAAPDAGVLWGLCQIYSDLEIDPLLAFLVHTRSGLPVAAPKRAATTTPPDISDDEWQLVHTFRRLAPAGQRATLDFVTFQAGRGAQKPEPSPVQREHFRGGRNRK